ncbi:TPA: hypothetical protein DIS56_04240 [Candidatus Saccharibacteria bacterium]|nr:MAG: hypothetical protein UX30_C0003G0040 [Candidatus Saccharibacteria bacterium GW2011_GWA2_46_10]OGL36359.1 MAG: hypothetical protein A3F05_01245 [Candidatus Saccharibacteria bacterium RIFCSPHIGHO2_12_FULL_47_17]HCM52302.1 hypothetical protein [Candidatus Saccharibacteria bacterium]
MTPRPEEPKSLFPNLDLTSQQLALAEEAYLASLRLEMAEHGAALSPDGEIEYDLALGYEVEVRLRPGTYIPGTVFIKIFDEATGEEQSEIEKRRKLRPELTLRVAGYLAVDTKADIPIALSTPGRLIPQDLDLAPILIRPKDVFFAVDPAPEKPALEAIHIPKRKKSKNTELPNNGGVPPIVGDM